MKTDYKYAKFICPSCGKKFRWKIDPRLDVITHKDGSIFTCHTHCPRCEEPIPWRDRRKVAK